MNNPTIVWFRRDLRLEDNAALCWAAERARPIVPVFIWSPEDDGEFEPGAATRVWLHHALKSLSADLAHCGLPLTVRAGPTVAILERLIADTGASAVAYNRVFEPLAVRRDARVEATLVARGIDVFTGNGMLMAEPRDLKNKQGTPYKVFTPFWKTLSARGAPARPLSLPANIGSASAALRPTESRTDGNIANAPSTIAQIDALRLMPMLPWGASMAAHWNISESGAQARLADFVRNAAGAYATGRDRPDIDGISRMSPYLHFGQITPAQIWHAADTDSAHEPYLRQLGWREFAHHLLNHFPATTTEPLNTAFEQFPWWKEDAELTGAWQRGETGYPLIDAGMRELWATGWMHNRVRMNAGSLLVKHLLGHWHIGARWFWDTLVDADLANNTMGWQWIAGCGADAAPYFRIFNPVTQGERFDPEGRYIRQWVPELRQLPSTHIHAPWTAPGNVLRAAGITLGKTYPRPLVDHKKARERALASLATIRR